MKVKKLISELKKTDLTDILIVFDSVKNFIIGDRNSHRDVTQFMNVLKVLRGNSASIIFLHHQNKLDKEFNSAFAGSSAFLEDISLAFELRKNEDKQTYIFIPIKDRNNVSNYIAFTYNQDKDCFVCENQKELNFQRLVFKRSTLNYYRLYSRARKLCKDCPRLSICEIDQGAIRINASGNYPAFHRNKLKYHTPEYVKVMRLRKIWAEGTFSVLKREHNLKRIHKRGIIRAEEECLFSAMALNLKRLVKAM